ncbi:MAG: hypothetical protein ACI8PT_004739 [Gammaproteobacteria bacterium]
MSGLRCVDFDGHSLTDDRRWLEAAALQGIYVEELLMVRIAPVEDDSAQAELVLLATRCGPRMSLIRPRKYLCDPHRTRIVRPLSAGLALPDMDGDVALERAVREWNSQFPGSF